MDWDNLDVLESRSGGGAVGSGGSGAGAGVVSGGGGAAGGRPRTSNEDGSEEQSVAQELNELTKESWEVSLLRFLDSSCQQANRFSKAAVS